MAAPHDELAPGFVTVAVTTCKRFDPFAQVIESFLNHCQDHQQVAEWICIDDNSSDCDRRRVAERFPFLRFLAFESAEENGCARRMNLMLEQVHTPFVFHLEDDWTFCRDFRLADLLGVLRDGKWQCIALHLFPNGLPLGQTRGGVSVQEHLYNPDHPAKPEVNRRYDAMYPLQRPGAEGGWWWPGFTLSPSLFDVQFFRSAVGRFDERIHRDLSEYDYARRAHDAGARCASVDCGIIRTGAVSASGVSDHGEPGAAAPAISENDGDREDPGRDLAARIPNVIHFIHLEGEAPFGFYNLLAILTAYVVQQPDAIFLYCDRPPRGGRWWEAVKRYVTLVPRPLPAAYGGIRLRSLQHQAEVLRLQILSEQGGISLETDVLTLKPYNPLRHQSCVLGTDWQPSDSECPAGNSDQIAAVSSAVLMSAPGHPFVSGCLDDIRGRGSADSFSDGKLVDLAQVARRHRDLVHIEPAESFLPFACDSDEPFRNADQNAIEEIFARKLSRSYCFSLWQRFWRGRFLNAIGPEYLQERKNLMGAFFQGYLFYLDENHGA